MDRDHPAIDLDRAHDTAALLAVLAPPRRPCGRHHRADHGDHRYLADSLGNWLPAFSTALLGLALSERDGILFALGSVVGLVAMALVASVMGAVIAATTALLNFLSSCSAAIPRGSVQSTIIVF